jgi:type I restriction enzyme, R subunit
MIKIIWKYHQFFWVNKAIERVKTREQNKWKIWVFWHTQGSWKSFSMVFFSQKVMRKLPWNFTFVVVTDRTELDNQIYKQFVNVWAIKKQETQANSIDNLKELLKWDNRYIFTLIHKFQFKDWEIPWPINTRNDIIIITDEAHRSQYDTLAMNMRMSLPNACFIGFTWTPLIDKEQEKTKEVFWNYVSIYNFSQSVEDGATVPIYYENRVPKLENINEDLEKDLEKIMEKFELWEDEEDKLENEFSTAYQILTREDRLESVWEDIVNHFMWRWNEWKAMVVCIDKKTTVRVYFKVKKYFGVYKAKLESDLERMLLDWEKEEIKKKIKFIENLDMAVVISLWKNQNEIDDFRQIWIDFKPIRKRLLEMDW